ncbi:MAG: SMP-30/gluconolactonase/LRE family protein [Leptothrix sp. (in: b-proteobacteria)]
MERLIPAHLDAVGESPLWSVLEQALYWVDIEGRALHRWQIVNGRFSTWRMPERLACIALHGDGGLVAGMDSGLFHLRPGLGQDSQLGIQPLVTIEHPHTGMRCNDGRCDRQGRFWVGTMVRDMALAEPAGVLHRFDRAGLSAPLQRGLITPNGLAFSPDGRTAYLSDSHPSMQRIWTFELHDDGSLGARRLFVDMRALPGRPDGAAIDTDGGYWICANDAGLVHRFTPDGRLDRSITVPTSKPSMCSFGGPDLDLLFITTIRPAAAQGDDIALGGAVFVTRPGVRGLAETPFTPPLEET